MLSNLHSFHFGALLQNSSALPWRVYNNTTNKLLVGRLKPKAVVTKASTDTLQTITSRSLKKGLAYPSGNLIKKPLITEPGKTDETHMAEAPGPETNTLSAPGTQNQPADHRVTARVTSPARHNHSNHQPAKKSAPKWRPGPGVIEKVDKATGEIMHLSAA